MKLWDSLTACLVLLSAVHAGPLLHGTGARTAESPPVLVRLSVTSPGASSTQPAAREGTPGGKCQEHVQHGYGNVSVSLCELSDELAPFYAVYPSKPLLYQELVTRIKDGRVQYTLEDLRPNEFEDMVEFIKVTISRIGRSSSTAMPSSASTSSTSPREQLSNRTRHRRERTAGGRGGGGGVRGKDTQRRNRGSGGRRREGCVLKQIHLNVTDLGLGYRSSEEMIFRYCSGPCRRSESNYDKILYNLLHNRKLPLEDAPSPVCCRPIAFDDNLSFLDDNLIYHTVRKHSARRCACV